MFRMSRRTEDINTWKSLGPQFQRSLDKFAKNLPSIYNNSVRSPGRQRIAFPQSNVDHLSLREVRGIERLAALEGQIPWYANPIRMSVDDNSACRKILGCQAFRPSFPTFGGATSFPESKHG
jgi:hypothetical protein